MSPAPQLRDYQTEVISQYRQAIASSYRRILLVAPTGSGKTVIAAAIIRDALQGEADEGMSE